MGLYPRRVLRRHAGDPAALPPERCSRRVGARAHHASSRAARRSSRACWRTRLRRDRLGRACTPAIRAPPRCRRRRCARWRDAVGAPVYEGYGQTEAGPVLTFNPGAGVRKPGSVGVPVPRPRSRSSTSRPARGCCRPGERGEIRARGPQLMQGYRNRREETAQALRDGWLYTGDIGELDADGYLYIRDRKKDMVIVGGYNVYPREVEEVLFAHPAVLEAAVVGVPDAYRGEVVHAHVVLRAGAARRRGAARALRANLARYKVPARSTVVDALPKTPVGKIDRKALRAPRLSAPPVQRAEPICFCGPCRDSTYGDRSWTSISVCRSGSGSCSPRWWEPCSFPAASVSRAASARARGRPRSRPRRSTARWCRCRCGRTTRRPAPAG